MIKTTVILMLSGALAGIAVASFIVPSALSWYTAPGGLPKGAQIQALVEIPEVIWYATGRLIRAQEIGAVIGALTGLGVRVFLGVRKRSPANDLTGATGAQPPA